MVLNRIGVTSLFRSRCMSLVVLFLLITALSTEFVPAQTVSAPEVPPAGPAAPVSFRLEGIWAGVGYLDEEKLAAKLEAMPAGPERDVLVNKAATFLTIVAALEFRANGELETDLEVTDADGKAHNEPTKGRWTLVERKESRFLVELQETLEDKSERKSQRLIQFYEDGAHIAVLMESDPLLAEFNPLIVLERVPDRQIAEAAKPEASGIDRR